MCLRNRLDIVGGKNMFADDTKTQVWARDALPILVQRAQEGRTINFSELTDELGLSGGYYNLKMSDVAGILSKPLPNLKGKMTGKEKYRILHL